MGHGNHRVWDTNSSERSYEVEKLANYSHMEMCQPSFYLFLIFFFLIFVSKTIYNTQENSWPIKKKNPRL